MLRSRPPIVLEIDEAIAQGAPKRLEVKLPHNDMTRYEDREPCQPLMRVLMEELLSRVANYLVPVGASASHEDRTTSLASLRCLLALRA